MSEQSHLQTKSKTQPLVTSTSHEKLQRQCNCSKAQDETTKLPILHNLLSSQPPKIQPKLKIGTVNDKYEKEADRIAEQVIRMPVSGLQHQSNKTNGIELSRTQPKVQRQIDQGRGTQTNVPPIVHNVLRSPGHPLPTATRHLMESHLSRDFSQIRVHTNHVAANSAQSVAAKAYTVGKHIVFGARQYSPTSFSGQKLLAHELVHTIQQRGARVVRPLSNESSKREAPLQTRSNALQQPSFLSRARLQRQPTATCVRAMSPERVSPSNLATGKAVERLIVSHLERRHGPNQRVELPDASFGAFRTGGPTSIIPPQVFGGPRQGIGIPDVAYRSRTGRAMLLAEIKPGNWPQFIAGEAQLLNYITKGNSDDNADIRRQLGIRVFSPMFRGRFRLPRTVSIGTRRYRILWCAPGLITYSLVGGRRRRRRRRRGQRRGSSRSEARRQARRQARRRTTRRSVRRATRRTTRRAAARAATRRAARAVTRRTIARAVAARAATRRVATRVGAAVVARTGGRIAARFVPLVGLILTISDVAQAASKIAQGARFSTEGVETLPEGVEAADGEWVTPELSEEEIAEFAGRNIPEELLKEMEGNEALQQFLWDLAGLRLERQGTAPSAEEMRELSSVLQTANPEAVRRILPHLRAATGDQTLTDTLQRALNTPESELPSEPETEGRSTQGPASGGGTGEADESVSEEGTKLSQSQLSQLEIYPHLQAFFNNILVTVANQSGTPLTPAFLDFLLANAAALNNPEVLERLRQSVSEGVQDLDALQQVIRSHVDPSAQSEGNNGSGTVTEEDQAQRGSSQTEPYQREEGSEVTVRERGSTGRGVEGRRRETRETTAESPSSEGRSRQRRRGRPSEDESPEIFERKRRRVQRLSEGEVLQGEEAPGSVGLISGLSRSREYRPRQLVWVRILINGVHEVRIPLRIIGRTPERSRTEEGRIAHQVTIAANVEGNWAIEGTNILISSGADFTYIFRWTR